VLQTLPRSDTGAPMLTGAGSAPRMSAAAPAAEESVEAPAAAYEEAEAPSDTAEEQLETQMLFLSDGSDAATNAEAAMQQLTEAAPETDAAAPEAAWGEEEAVAPTSEDPGMLCGLAPESAGTAANAAAETEAPETTASTTAETTTADAKENAADAPLTLEGEGAAAWLAEHAEPLGDGLWRVRVEDTLTLPETLRLVGLQEPEDGMLTILFETTENPR
ncbi:MAG: hypothetical protein K6G54_04415, partial [Oscillospiraceae bacterium]|nr:hypothetical protein [Oscillospiraceae bacterium]